MKIQLAQIKAERERVKVKIEAEQTRVEAKREQQIQIPQQVREAERAHEKEIYTVKTKEIQLRAEFPPSTQRW